MTARREFPAIERNRSWLCQDGSSRAFRPTVSLLILYLSVPDSGTTSLPFRPKQISDQVIIMKPAADRVNRLPRGNGGWDCRASGVNSQGR